MEVLCYVLWKRLVLKISQRILLYHFLGDVMIIMILNLQTFWKIGLLKNACWYHLPDFSDGFTNFPSAPAFYCFLRLLGMTQVPK